MIACMSYLHDIACVSYLHDRLYDSVLPALGKRRRTPSTVPTRVRVQCIPETDAPRFLTPLQRQNEKNYSCQLSAPLISPLFFNMHYGITLISSVP